MRVIVKAKGLDKATAALLKKHKAKIERGVRRIATLVREIASDEAPKKTGRFAEGIHKTPTGDLSWDIYESHKRGLWIREGTIGHSIFPRRKKALAWPGLPHPVAWAAHPGTKPNPYHERAVDRAEPEVQKELDVMGTEITKDMDG